MNPSQGQSPTAQEFLAKAANDVLKMLPDADQVAVRTFIAAQVAEVSAKLSREIETSKVAFKIRQDLEEKIERDWRLLIALTGLLIVGIPLAAILTVWAGSPHAGTYVTLGTGDTVMMGWEGVEHVRTVRFEDGESLLLTNHPLFRAVEIDGVSCQADISASTPTSVAAPPALGTVELP